MLLNSSRITRTRLCRQQIAASTMRSPAEVVSWMGAVQAQDYAMSRWAIGARMGEATPETIEKAANTGAILRTHVLRPTWHWVAGEDIAWMLDVTAPHIRKLLAARLRELGLTAAIILKCQRVLEKALRDGRFLSRAEINGLLSNAGLPVQDQRLSHLLMQAELDQVICSGPTAGNKITFALFAERVKNSRRMPREEALATLAHRYFRSHGPATVYDFSWWSGLPVTDSRRAISMVQASFETATLGGHQYWFSEGAPHPASKGVFLLPAYDEFFISYKDRSACITDDDHKRKVSIHGTFRPIVVVNGTVKAVWHLVRDKKSVRVKIESLVKSKEPAAFPAGFKKAVARATDFFSATAG